MRLYFKEIGKLVDAASVSIEAGGNGRYFLLVRVSAKLEFYIRTDLSLNDARSIMDIIAHSVDRAGTGVAVIEMRRLLTELCD